VIVLAAEEARLRLRTVVWDKLRAVLSTVLGSIPHHSWEVPRKITSGVCGCDSYRRSLSRTMLRPA